ncbi:MAG: Maf family protein [Oscillospiraceae bacterium]
MSLILASSSPRRQELLRLITDDFLIDPPTCDEALPHGIQPEDGVAVLAMRKASDVFARHPDELVIGADTVVALGRTLLGKPRDRDDAARMLSLLSGCAHRVYTGVCVLSGEYERTFVSSARVHFSPMSAQEIADYTASGECEDKAGAYAIQGRGARFIDRIDGDYYAVMGLPVCRLYQLLRDLAWKL